MIKGLAGDPLAWSLLTGALGALLWLHEHHFQRLTAWLFAAAAAFAVAGIPAWRDALAGLTTTGAGLTVLAVLGLLVFPTFHLSAIRSSRQGRLGGYLQKKAQKKAQKKGGASGGAVVPYSAAPRRNRYHRTRTPAIAMAAGTLAVVVLGAWRILAAHAGKSAAGTLHALVESGTKINNGQAAKALPASHRPGVIIAGVVILALIVAVMGAYENSKKKPKKGLPAGGRP